MFVFPLTFVLFPACLWSFILWFDKEKTCTEAECLLYSLGLAPALVSLYMYYALLLFPGLERLFYILPVCGLFIAAGAIGFREARLRVSRDASAWIQSMRELPGGRRAEIMAFWALIILPLSWFMWHYLSHALWHPLTGQDVLEYANQGRFFHEHLMISPFFEVIVPDSWIMFRSKHAPSFPLLLTWELLLSTPKNPLPDLFFRTVGTWYGLLILAVQGFWLAKLNRWLAMLGIWAVLGSSWFFIALMAPHLDTFRIFLLILSWIWMAKHIRDGDRFSLYMFGACSGLAAFAHSIGVFAAAFNLAALVVFSRGGFWRRLGSAVLAGLLILLFGGGHYLIDLLWGRGWVVGY